MPTHDKYQAAEYIKRATKACRIFTKNIVLPSNSNWALTESLVKPASGPTTTRISCNNIFSKVDFPTFGRPTIANCNGTLDSSSSQKQIASPELSSWLSLSMISEKKAVRETKKDGKRA